jgi:hypothetical protein
MGKRVVWTRQAAADVRAIEKPVAMQILRTLARYARTGEGDTKQLRDIEPPLIGSGTAVGPRGQRRTEGPSQREALPHCA